MANEPDVERLIAQAEGVMRDAGWAERLQDVAPEDWQRLIDRLAARAQRDGVALSEGWKTKLTKYRDSERLRTDADDARLAEEGEVFSREDDA